ncbi:MAG: cytochrome P450, partial [Cytophagaceae bacterium]
LAKPDGFDKHFQKYSYGVIGRYFFGLQVRSADDAFVLDNEAFITTTMRSFDPVAFPVNLFPWLAYLTHWLLPHLREIRRVRDLTDDRVRDLVRDVARQTGKKSTSTPAGVFNEFLASRNEYDISDEEANSAFFALIGAGTPSPHNALLTFVYLMMAYPEWQRKLHAQIDEVVGPKCIPAWSDIPNLPIVRAIVKEGIRYRTIVAELGIPHQLSQNDEYDRYRFKKGTTFHANYGCVLFQTC